MQISLVALIVFCNTIIILSQQIIPLERFDFSQEGGPEDSYELISSTVRVDQEIFTVGIADLTIDGQRFTVPWMTRSNLSGEILQSNPILLSVEIVEGIIINNQGNLVIFGDSNFNEIIVEVNQNLELIQSNTDARYLSSLIQRSDNKYVGVNIDRLVVYNEDLSFNKEIFITESGLGGATYHEIIQKGENYLLTGFFSGTPYENFPNISSTGGLDFVILEVDENGDVQWANSLEGDKDETFFDDLEIGLKDRFLSTTESSYLITLTSRSTEGDFQGGLNSTGSWVFRIDQGGEIVWSKSIVHPISDIRQVNSSEVIFTTRAAGFGNSLVECDTCQSYVAWLGVLDFATGDLTRQSYLDAERDEYFTAFEVGDAGIVLYGITESYEGSGIFYDDFFASDTDDAIICYYPVSTSFVEPIDSDNDGFNSDVDCDDTDPSIYPGAIEICDDIDNNCNGEIDDGLNFQVYYIDNDGDGFGDDDTAVERCNDETGFVLIGGDCNDADSEINPNASDIPDNGIDEDCDGVDAMTVLEDNDNDGFDTSVDCDDTDPNINPEAIEICDDIDNDCDGDIDEDLSFVVYYIDSDGDGYGNDNTAQESCQGGFGLVLQGGDCDDTVSTINPGAVDIPNNGIDENCDGVDAMDGPCSHPDFDALVSFYNNTGGDNWLNKAGWTEGVEGTDCDVCDWYGVTCSNGRVQSIVLANNNLTGILPTSTGLIDELESLLLSQNLLTGVLPNDIGSLASLRILDLSNNDFEGSLPDEIYNLSQLEYLLLQSNNFTGEISNNIGDLNLLKVLSIQSNQFVGSLPTTIGSLVNLEEFYLFNNLFRDAIPDNFLGLSNLKVFHGALNQFDGVIPSSLGMLNLETVFLEFNNLSGCIPETILNLCDIEINLENDQLPWNGVIDNFCNEDQQIGASCVIGSNVGTIDENCNCQTASNVESFYSSYLSLYPNPIKDYLTLKTTQKCSYQVVSTLGVVVSEGTCLGESQISLLNQDSGLYFVIIDQSRSYKVVKL